MRPRADPAVQIVTSPEAVQTARAAGESYARRLPPIPGPDPLDRLGDYRLSHTEMVRFAQERARGVPRLREIAADGGAPAAAACISLVWLGQPEFIDRLLELLATPAA